jgi:soluble lytic murein transglycosylase-like protein
MFRVFLTKKMPLIILGLLPLGLPVIPSSLRADIYRFQDERGVVHFTNTPTDSKFRLFLKEPQTSRTGPPSKGNSKTFSSSISNLNNYTQLAPHIDEASQQYGIDPKLIRAVIHVESNFDPQAVSLKGAQGLMQLMPQTARDLQVSDVFSPKENIDGGTRYLRYLMDIYNQDMSLALAAYNAGPEKVNQYRGIPPYQETKTYVQKVTEIYKRLRSPFLSNK